MPQVIQPSAGDNRYREILQQIVDAIGVPATLKALADICEERYCAGGTDDDRPLGEEADVMPFENALGDLA